MKNILNGICVGLAFLCVGLGAVGIVLPFLPTTPFFLVAAALFAKGSKRFHRWFTGTALYRKHLEPFVESKSMTMKKKLSVLAMVTALLTIGSIMSPIWHARVVIVIVALAHYYVFFFRIKTAPAGESSEAAEVAGCVADGHEASRDSDGLSACGYSAEGQVGCSGSAPASGDDIKPAQSAGVSSAASCGLLSDHQKMPQSEGSGCSGVTGTAEKSCVPADTGYARIREAADGIDRVPQGSADRYCERRMEKGEENVS